MAESPRVLEFIEELWEDWEDDLEDWAKSMETNVQDKMQEHLLGRVNALGPPKQEGQRQFIEKVKTFITHNISARDSPFFEGMDRLQREQVDVAIEKVKEAETLEEAQKIIRKTSVPQGFKIEIPKETNRVSVTNIFPQVQAGELARRGEIAKELEDALQEKALEEKQEELNKIIDEEASVSDRLKETSADRWRFTVADIIDTVESAKNAQDLEVIRRDITRLPFNSRRLAERLVNLKRQELK